MQIELHEIKNNARALGINASDLFGILTCDHDHQKTIELFRTVYPAPSVEPAPEAADDRERRVHALKQRLAELEARMRAVASFDDPDLVALYEEWVLVTKEISELQRSRT